MFWLYSAVQQQLQDRFYLYWMQQRFPAVVDVLSLVHLNEPLASKTVNTRFNWLARSNIVQQRTTTTVTDKTPRFVGRRIFLHLGFGKHQNIWTFDCDLVSPFSVLPLFFFKSNLQIDAQHRKHRTLLDNTRVIQVYTAATSFSYFNLVSEISCVYCLVMADIKIWLIFSQIAHD